MKVLGISGSPRRDGNTSILLDRVLAGASHQRAETQLIDLAALDVHPCTHCDYCPGNECIYHDDMKIVYDGLEWADAVALSSPLHFMTVTSQLKTVIDRCQLCWERKYRLNRPPLGTQKYRRGLFISVGGRKSGDIFEPARVTAKAFFRSLDIEYWGELVYAGIDEKGDIFRFPQALDEAFKAGMKLAAGEPF